MVLAPVNVPAHEDEPAPVPVAGPMRNRLSRLISGVDLRGVITTLAIRFAGAGLGFFSHVEFARLLGQAEYGQYAGLWAWVVLLGMLAPLGLATANTRLAAQYLERGRLSRVRGLFSFAVITPLVSGMVLGALFAALELAVTGGLSSADWRQALPVLLAAACVPLFALGESLRGLARGHGLTTLAYAPAFLWRPLLLMLLALAAWATLGRVDLTLLLAASLLAIVLTVAAQMVILWRHTRRATDAARRSARHAGAWLSISLPLLLVDGYFILSANMDVVVLRHFAPAKDVGAYYAAARIAALVNFFPLMIGAQAAPRLARLWTRGEVAELTVLGRKYALLAVGGTAGAFLALVVLGDFALSLFGPGFAVARPAMLLLAGGIVLQALAGPVRYLLAMAGQERAMAAVMVSAAVINIALNLLLVPPHGMMGAAAATVLSGLFFTLALATVAWRRLGVWTGIGPLRLPAAT